MKYRHLLAQGQRRTLNIQDPAAIYRGELPAEQSVVAVAAPSAPPPPPAQQYVGTLTITQLNELTPWLAAVTLDSSGNTDLAGGYLAADVIKIHDDDDSNELSIIWNEAETASNRTLNLLVHAGNRTLDLSENLTIADGSNVTLTAEDAATSILMDNANFEVENTNGTQRNFKITSVKAGNTTLTFQENLTISDGYDVTLQALGQANSLILNESLTIGDGNSGTITFGNASDVLTINETMTLAGASGKTLTLTENLTIGDGTDITITGVGQANTLTLYESLTLGDGNSGTLTFSASGDTLTVGETLTLDGASGKTLTLEENLTVSDGTDIILASVTQANTLTLNESLTLGDGYSGTITFSAASKVLTIDESASMSDFVREADYGIQTILRATTNNTPTALTVTEQTLVGRITSGNIAALSTTQIRTLINVEDGSTADQTGAEITTAINGQTVTALTVTTLTSDSVDGVDVSAFKTAYDSHAAAANPHSGHALESVLGTSIGAGLLLDATVLKASAILQKYHAIDPAANVQSLLGAADYAAMMALLSGEAGATFDINDQQISNIKSLAFNDGGATITQIKDEDDMASDSATMLATQQSIKKYAFTMAAIMGTL